MTPVPPPSVLVHAKRMKEPWGLATSLGEQSAAAIVKLYGRRFTIEQTFRDQKDLRFGMGLRETRIRKEARRTDYSAAGPRPNQ
jgi:hypothetical protein